MVSNESNAYALTANNYFGLILVKFVSSMALHMMLFPFVNRSLTMMKYALNHEKEFTHPVLATLVPFVDLNINIIAEVLNLYMLLYQHTVEHAIIHFVALEIIVEIPHRYVDGLIDDKLKDLVFPHGHHVLAVENKGREITFRSRTPTNKCGRFFYRAYRTLYVSFLFYFCPFIVIMCYKYMVPQGSIPAH